ncbi:branched-chain amino acid ABC transporter permease [Albidovulum sp.]|uniref:branched-chain amino acid ABC transporter permease n=1 Tax=Albidovulum sp. TaxID=1872424 RepID=UPI001D539428|nr:branched-chain amino acid ABC transporter permease [Paracoccaceae bacterium]HPE26309.1 branched-chain amino acid ABC transporter permease [Albidovulum sp.]MCB2120720.1 branched-chain amino acid ABC transporter permease [Paracoccaceae bacterium]MCB2131249.1 branched-chain amino acid ABC transporter permease [Paracoccaceae bacterium]MCB2140388.1 branched-chain amino acid ABC transporter permease [Paracoccaceae bacterium]
MTLLAQYALTGVVTGCFLILATIGFSLTRQVEGFLNIAHAEMLGVSAFITWGLNAVAGWPFIPSAAVAVVATAFLGLAIGRVVYDPMRRHGPAVLLITSVGVAYVMAGMMHAIIGTGIRSLNIPLATSYRAFGLRLTDYQMIVVALAAITGVSLALFMNRTRTGLAIRAMSANPELAASRGIDVRQTSRATWLIASGLAGLAGVVLALIATLSTDIAFNQILQILAVAILAGLGSLYSVIAAGLIVGIAMDLSVYWIPAGYRPLIAFMVVILALLVRPQGLSGKARS